MQSKNTSYLSPLFVSVIFIFSILIYVNTLGNKFVYDDLPQLLNNHLIRDVKNLPEIFFSSAWSFQDKWKTNYYRPMMHAIYTLEYYIFDLNPWGFHLTNIIFNSANSILVYFLTLSILSGLNRKQSLCVDNSKSNTITNKNTSFICALLFASHPIHTESVAWIAAIPELSFTFFCLISFYFYLKIDEGNKSDFILALLFFFIALFCKETAITLLILFIIYDGIKRRELNSVRLLSLSKLKKQLPFWALTSVYLAIRCYAIGGFSQSNRHTDLTTYQYFINIPPLFIQYIEALILPLNLNVFHIFNPISSVFEFKVVAAFIFFFLYFSLVVFFYYRNISIFFALVWICVTLMPVHYIPGLGVNVFTERYLYLPSVGFTIFLSIFLSSFSRLKNGKIFTISMVVIILCFYFTKTVQRNVIWKNNIALWQDTVKKSPEALAVQYNLGVSYFYEEMFDEAINHLEMAVNIAPKVYEAHSNLGLAYHRKGLLNKSVNHYLIALEINSKAVKVHNNLGVVYFDMKNIDQAIQHYTRALQIKPDYDEARQNLANAIRIKQMREF